MVKNMDEANTYKWATALSLIGADDDRALELGKEAYRSMDRREQREFYKTHKDDIHKFVPMLIRKGLIT